MFLLLLLLSLGGSQSQIPGYGLVVSPSQKVEEGLCIYIPCTFFYPYSWRISSKIYGYWFKKIPMINENVIVATNDQNSEVDKVAMGRFHLVGDPTKNNCSLSITDVQKKDSGRYFFRMERGLQDKFSYLSYTFHLYVTDLTQKPDIFLPAILEPGHPVTLLCAAPWVCREGTPPTFSWTGAAVSNLGPSRGTPYFSELTLTPRPQDHGTSFTCRMTFPGAGVRTETTIPLNVAYPVRDSEISVDRENGRDCPRILGPSCLWAEEGSLCTCSVQGDLAPPSLHWWVGESIVHGNSSDNTFRVAHSTNSTWTNSSLVLAKKLDPGLGIRCEGRNPDGTHSASVLLLVPAFSVQENSSWPLVLTLLRGALMGAGFLLTYGLTWLYYTWKPLGRE
ncbi:sialic acid-binding Ig-like lectin 14 [Notamacropus eugenii]|uniref:sialic acid-binding Ig-like lectin 14 n=1 Tax=Notamacropus eugenii TaxID=9315 RepID=UPI003B67FC2A